MKNRPNIVTIVNRLIFIGLIVVLGVFWFRGKSRTIEPSSDLWFQAEVANEVRPVLVKFGAEWCGPCHTLDDSIDQVAPRLESQVKFLRVDVDQNRNLAKHYQISSIPRTFLFYRGAIVADQTGSLDPSELQSWIQNALAGIPNKG